MEQSNGIICLSPVELRLLIRNEDPRISTTSGLSNGYQQANVTILPSCLAKDFEAFCQSNAAPLPLLYRSQPGETFCLPMAQEADIRTDIPRYCVYKNGSLMKTISSLKDYCTEFKDMVCFYLGCSFGFEGRLKKAGVPVRNVEQGKNVSMYKTSVPCVPVGDFQCPLVVTMRPIPAEMLDTAVEVTHLNPLAHGAPVHIGDPAFLGIQDLSRPDYGDAVEQQPGDVPTFWACGVTSIEAVRSSKPSLAFSHSPGCMFLTDLPDTSSSSSITLSHQNEDPELIPRCFQLSHKPLFYSLASKRAVEKIRQLETIIRDNPDRPTQALSVQDELVRCCIALSHASSVAIVTDMSSLPDKTDSPPGAIAIANMLLSLGKQVTMVTDRKALEMNQAIIDEAVRSGVLDVTVPLVTFENKGPDCALHFLCDNGEVSKLSYDHLVVTEHCGQAAEVFYNKIRESHNIHSVDPFDNLLITAKDIPGINTSSVSNWGGHAVACGLFLLQTCPSHQRYIKKGLGLNEPIPQEQLQK